eukprot:scaffold3663_cov249-Prasinococcus_capsulatus_cf.AAC.1
MTSPRPARRCCAAAAAVRRTIYICPLLTRPLPLTRVRRAQPIIGSTRGGGGGGRWTFMPTCRPADAGAARRLLARRATFWRERSQFGGGSAFVADIGRVLYNVCNMHARLQYAEPTALTNPYPNHGLTGPNRIKG